ncbi:MAG: hypothetical protein IPH18_17205 [Chitinophagaceae bacterium]|nr:hypothetical protein [Chitinophagaceae bacterium]
MTTAAVQATLYPLIFGAFLVKAPLDHAGENEEHQCKCSWALGLCFAKSKMSPVTSIVFLIDRILDDGNTKR